MIYKYQNLEVYQEAFDLAVRIHSLSQSLPRSERYEMGRQMRRASKGIAACIAEGYGRRESSREFKRYLSIAYGSVQEMKVWIEFCQSLDYLEPKICTNLWEEYDRLGKRLYKLRSVWQSRDQRAD